MQTPQFCIRPSKQVKMAAKKEAKKLQISLAKWVEFAMIEKLQRNKYRSLKIKTLCTNCFNQSKK